MSDDLADAYDLPEDFNIQAADHFERVEAADGTELCVLINHYKGERELVHADVVDFEGVLEHPMTTGVVGFAAILTAFLAPLFVSVQFASSMSGLLQVGTGLAGVVWGFVMANLVLYRTFIGNWLFRFLEWNDYKYQIMGRETA